MQGIREKVETAQWKVLLQPPALRAMPQGVWLLLTYVQLAANKDCTIVMHEIRRTHMLCQNELGYEEVGTSRLIKNDHAEPKLVNDAELNGNLFRSFIIEYGSSPKQSTYHFD